MKTYPGIELINFPEGPSLAALRELGHLAPDDGLLHVKSDLVEDLLDEGQAVLVAEAGGPLHSADGTLPPEVDHELRPVPAAVVLVGLGGVGEQFHVDDVGERITTLPAVDAGRGLVVHLDGLALDADLEGGRPGRLGGGQGVALLLLVVALDHGGDDGGHPGAAPRLEADVDAVVPVGAGGSVAGRFVLEGVADGVDDALEVVGADLEGRHGIVPVPDLPRGEVAVVLGQLGGRLLEGGSPEGRTEGLAFNSLQVRAEERARGTRAVEQD